MPESPRKRLSDFKESRFPAPAFGFDVVHTAEVLLE